MVVANTADFEIKLLIQSLGFFTYFMGNIEQVIYFFLMCKKQIVATTSKNCQY